LREFRPISSITTRKSTKAQVWLPTMLTKNRSAKMQHNSNKQINLAALSSGPTTGEYYKQPATFIGSLKINDPKNPGGVDINMSFQVNVDKEVIKQQRTSETVQRTSTGETLTNRQP